MYGYVKDNNCWVDVFGLLPGIGFFSDLKSTGIGHHPIPRSHANANGLPNLGTTRDTPSWYPNEVEDSKNLHYNFHDSLEKNGVPFSTKFEGTQEELITKVKLAYQDFEQKGYLKIPRTGEIIATDITIGEAVDKQLEWDKNKSNCSNK